MNLKKFAIRGLIILAIVVALCMFFSGTVRTITTPKVRLSGVKRGKLEERVTCACKVAFPDAEQIRYALEDGMSLVVTKVNTRVGYTVDEGDTVLEARGANYDQLHRQYQDAFESASRELMTLETKNRGIHVNRRDQAYADAYFALSDARATTVAMGLELDVQLSKEGMELPEEGYPKHADKALKQMIDEYREAVAARDEAEAKMAEVGRYSVDDTVWNYIVTKHDQEGKRDEAEENLRKLAELNDGAAAITAPHDGSIASLEVRAGDSYDGSGFLYSITPDGELPVLRADVSEVKQTVTEGVEAEYIPLGRDAVGTEVIATGTDDNGRDYADIELTKKLMKARGSVYAMTQEDTDIDLVFRASGATCLVPSSAVRGSGESRYVLTTSKNQSAFGGSTLKLSKQDVTVLGEYGGVTSVEEDLSNVTVAYGEDRPIAEGDIVMEYVN